MCSKQGAPTLRAQTPNLPLEPKVNGLKALGGPPMPASSSPFAKPRRRFGAVSLNPANSRRWPLHFTRMPQVRFRARDNRTGGKRTVTLPAEEFIARFLRHVLPPGFKRIRHYGLLAAGHKRARLAAARLALTMPEPQPTAIEAAEAFFAGVSGLDPCRCPHCAHGHWRTVAALAPEPRCRDGPPRPLRTRRPAVRSATPAGGPGHPAPIDPIGPRSSANKRLVTPLPP